MSLEESAIRFRCHDDWLYGIINRPDVACRRGVLIVVGGPQYRAGSHRQFTLLARHLAQQGIAAMRFDYRGMGDSQGEARDFENVEDDLRAAIDAFMEALPGMHEVVLWGLCDAASAATMYAASDARVTGLVLLNPWVRTADGLARTTLKHYYLERLRDLTFWRQLLSGRFSYGRSLKSIAQLAHTAFGARLRQPDTTVSLPERMHAGMRAFRGRVMVIVSGADLTGREFCDMTTATPKWKRLLESPSVLQRQLGGADHTFSKRIWRDQVADWTCNWLRSW